MRGIKWFMILTALALAALAVYLLIPQTPSSPPPVETESIKSEDALPAPASSQPALPQAETEAPQPQVAATVEPPEASPLPAEEMPDSNALLEQAASALGSGKPIAFDFRTKIAVVNAGATRDSHIEGKIELGTNNSGVLHLKDERMEVKVYNDGNTCIKYLPSQNQYLKVPPAVTRRALISTGMSGVLEAPFVWLSDLLEGKTPQNTPATVVSGDHNGTACWELNAETPQYRLKAQLSRGEPHTPLAVTMELKDAELEKQRVPKNIGLTLSTEFQNWQLSYDAPENYFTFTPPPGAVEVQPEGTMPQSAIGEGLPAPDFTLDDIDGSPVNLKNYLGKNIIILDFWATWCGPCRRVIPIVTEVSKEFADRGVILFTVNQRETPEKIRDFLQKQNLSINVLLDRVGQASRLYQVTGIPKVVIIGKDGLIKKIYAGMSGNLKASITQVLEELVQ